MRKKDSPSIILKHVSKKYVIHHEKPTLVEKFINGKEETFTALNNINLTIKKGERVGLMGPNGSGKTTLLKIITGISSPTSGKVSTHGKIVSLIDLEAGFSPDFTGIQNIYTNGMILGMSRREIAQKLDKIIEFADIHQFIDAPLFTYSQGMKLRLGFAVAIHANPEILVLDEFIGVGDENFQKKSLKAIGAMFKSGITIVMISHWYDYLKKYVQKILYLENGVIVKIEK